MNGAITRNMKYNYYHTNTRLQGRVLLNTTQVDIEGCLGPQH